MDSKEIKKELQKYASLERKKTNEWFFKTGKGQYGEGDIFIGVRAPDVRKVAKQFIETGLPDLEKILQSEIHEERLLALLILVERNKKAIQRKNREEQEKIVNLYLRNKEWVNNWDLVDASAHYILGQAVFDGLKSKKILTELINSSSMWDRRIGIIASWVFIKNGEIALTLSLSKKLLSDKEDLMYKAVGWMLRECWKLGEENKKSVVTSKSSTNPAKEKNKTKSANWENKKGKKAQEKVEQFLIKNYNKIPRTTLRYAIERMEEGKRKRFLKGRF